MTESTENQFEVLDLEAAEEYAAQRRENIRSFVHTNPEYYIKQFDKIGASSRFTPTFNPTAGLLGPVWFGARGLWMWAIPLLIIETMGYVQVARGLFGDLAADARERIASIEGTLELRRQQLAAAIEAQSDKVDVYKRTVKSLEDSIGGIRLEAQELSEQGIWIALIGLIILLAVKAAQSAIANSALEARFSEWVSDRSIRSGIPARQIFFSAIFMILIVGAAMYHYCFPGQFEPLTQFPTDPDIRLTGIAWVEGFFTFCVTNGEALFDFITYGIRLILDALELLFVNTPWIVIASFIVLLTWLTAVYGLRFGPVRFWRTWVFWDFGSRP